MPCRPRPGPPPAVGSDREGGPSYSGLQALPRSPGSQRPPLAATGGRPHPPGGYLGGSRETQATSPRWLLAAPELRPAPVSLGLVGPPPPQRPPATSRLPRSLPVGQAHPSPGARAQEPPAPDALAHIASGRVPLELHGSTLTYMSLPRGCRPSSLPHGAFPVALTLTDPQSAPPAGGGSWGRGPCLPLRPYVRPLLGPGRRGGGLRVCSPGWAGGGEGVPATPSPAGARP